MSLQNRPLSQKIVVSWFFFFFFFLRNRHRRNSEDRVEDTLLWETFTLIKEISVGNGVSVSIGKIPWRREKLPTPVFWPGEFHGLYNLWSRKEWDMTERLSLHFSLPLCARKRRMALNHSRILLKDSLQEEWNLPNKPNPTIVLAAFPVNLS